MNERQNESFPTEAQEIGLILPGSVAEQSGRAMVKYAKVLHFDDFIHLTDYPISQSSDEFTVFTPVGTNQQTAVTIADLNDWMQGNYPRPNLGLLLTGSTSIYMKLPKKATKSWVWVIPIQKTTLTLTSYNDSNQVLGSTAMGEFPALEPINFGTGEPLRAFRLDHSATIGIVRVEGYTY